MGNVYVVDKLPETEKYNIKIVQIYAFTISEYIHHILKVFQIQINI